MFKFVKKYSHETAPLYQAHKICEILDDLREQYKDSLKLILENYFGISEQDLLACNFSYDQFKKIVEFHKDEIQSRRTDFEQSNKFFQEENLKKYINYQIN